MNNVKQTKTKPEVKETLANNMLYKYHNFQAKQSTIEK